MSLAVLAQGSLAGDPVERTSAAGKVFVTGSLRVAVEGSESMLVSIIVFSASAVQAILELRKGDPVAVVGSAKPTTWTGKDGTEKHGLSVIVDRVMSLYEVRQRRKEAGTDPAEDSKPPQALGTHTPQQPYDRSQPIEEMADDAPF